MYYGYENKYKSFEEFEKSGQCWRVPTEAHHQEENICLIQKAIPEENVKTHLHCG